MARPRHHCGNISSELPAYVSPLWDAPPSLIHLWWIVSDHASPRSHIFASGRRGHLRCVEIAQVEYWRYEGADGGIFFCARGGGRTRTVPPRPTAQAIITRCTTTGQYAFLTLRRTYGRHQSQIGPIPRTWTFHKLRHATCPAEHDLLWLLVSSWAMYHSK